MKAHMKPEYQPKTGLPCDCKPGVQRDNCPECEGTGMRIDFARIRARRTEHEALRAVAEAAKPLLEAGERGLWGAWADNTPNGQVLKSMRDALAALKTGEGEAQATDHSQHHPMKSLEDSKNSAAYQPESTSPSKNPIEQHVRLLDPLWLYIFALGVGVGIIISAFLIAHS